MCLKPASSGRALLQAIGPWLKQSYSLDLNFNYSLNIERLAMFHGREIYAYYVCRAVPDIEVEV